MSYVVDDATNSMLYCKLAMYRMYAMNCSTNVRNPVPIAIPSGSARLLRSRRSCFVGTAGSSVWKSRKASSSFGFLLT